MSNVLPRDEEQNSRFGKFLPREIFFLEGTNSPDSVTLPDDENLTDRKWLVGEYYDVKNNDNEE